MTKLWWSVLDAGAVGDGTTDDTAAIQRACDAAAAGVAGEQIGTVYFPEGKTFLVRPAGSGDETRVAAGIDVPSQVRLLGHGATIRLAASDGQHHRAAVVVDNRREVHLEGLHIDGNRAGQSNVVRDRGSDGGIHGLALYGGGPVHVDKLRITDADTDGIYIDEHRPTATKPRHIHVTATRVTNSGRQGLSVIEMAGPATFTRCIFEDSNGLPPEAGVDLEPNFPGEVIESMVFRECLFRGNAGHGWMIHLPGAVARDITLESCVFEGNQAHPRYRVEASVYVTGAGVLSNIRIEGCRIGKRLQIASDARRGARARNVLVRGNLFRGPEAAVVCAGFARRGNQIRITENAFESNAITRIALGGVAGAEQERNLVAAFP